MTDGTATRGTAPSKPGVVAKAADELLLLVLVGVPVGVIVVGIGSRLAMLVLRVTSDASVIGIQSDDDFTIGQFTLSGTYNLLMIGAAVGVVGAAVYQWVRPWLLGPQWFRYVTVALAAGAVVGSMLVHADGIDFRLLEPTWLAIGLFVALPAVFGWAIAWTVDRFDRPNSWIHHGRKRWIVGVVSVALFPLTLFPIGLACAVLPVWIGVRVTLEERRPGPVPAWLTLVVRGVWLSIAVLGLMALINDVREINALV